MNDSSSGDELFDYTHNMASEVSFSAKMTKHNQKQPKAHHNTGFVLIIRDFLRKMTQKMQYLGSLGKKNFDRETFEYFIWDESIFSYVEKCTAISTTTRVGSTVVQADDEK